MAATQHPSTRAGRLFSRQSAPCCRAPSARSARPASRRVSRKLAPRVFGRKAAPRARQTLLLVLIWHQENASAPWQLVLGCVVTPNSAGIVQQPVSGQGAEAGGAGGMGWYLQSGTSKSHHVETDGKGGLIVVIAPGDVPFAYTNPVILNSIKIHEGTHLLDALNFNNGIGNNQPAGLILAADQVTHDLGEYSAIQKQLDYMDRYLSNPGTLTPIQVQQIQYYKVHVENYRAGIAGGPLQPMPPMPPPGT